MTRPDEVQRILRERAQALASERVAEAGDGSGELHVVAAVGDRRVGIPAVASRHVVPATPLASLVDCGPAIAGLAAVQGELVPVADLAVLLQVERTTGRTGSTRFLVVDDGEDALALLVDDVEGMRVLDAGGTAGERAAEGAGTGLVRGVVGDVYVLDLAAVLADDRGWPRAVERRAGETPI